MKKLTNKTAIITGGTSGIGKATTKLFAAEGASVVISGRNETQGNELVDDIINNGGKAIFVPGDISSYESNKLLVETTVNTFCGLDIIFPNA